MCPRRWYRSSSSSPAFVASILYLVSRRQHPSRALAADAIALATAEVGVVFCTVVLITGPLWARPVWGIWWTWDARLTTTLVLWLVYVSYLLLRRFAAGPQMQTLAAVLAIFGYVDVPIVYMSTTWWRTQHPGRVIGGGEGSLAPAMSTALWWNVLAWLAWGILIVGIRYAVERRKQRVEQHAALRALDNGSGSGTLKGNLMAHQHLVIAYVITWVIQLGYLGWVGTKWLAVRRDERQTPAYPEK